MRADNPAKPENRLQTAARFLIWLVALVFAWKMARVTWLHAEQLSPVDFYYFWDAAQNILHGDPARAYVAHDTDITRLEALGHPPPFLLATAPFGLLGFGGALVAWLVLTALILLIAARPPAALALAHPPTAYNVLFGQTGFLTAGIFIGGVKLLDRQPLLAGATMGLLVIKPQLGLLLPVALVAAGKWRALAAAAASSISLSVLAAIVFGPGIYRDWWAAVPLYGSWMVEGSRLLPWNSFISPYGLLRSFGVPAAIALTGHAIGAAGAAFITFRAWRENWDSKTAVLAAATVLISPYLFVYDAVLLIVPLCWLAPRSPMKALLLWALLLVPLLTTSFIDTSFLPFDSAVLPNMTPVAAVLALVFLWMERQSAPQTAARYH